MKRSGAFLLSLIFALYAAVALAGPDQFIGDAAIYSGSATATVRPNILLLIDNSNATTNAAHGTKYDATVDYCATFGGIACTYRRYSVYQAGQQGDFSTASIVDNPSSALANIVCVNNNGVVAATLRDKGTYAGSGTENYPNIKKSSGRSGGDTAVCDVTGKGATYALGNFLNYTLSPPWGTGESERKVIFDVIKTVLGGARYAVNFGAMAYGGNNKGGKVLYQVSDLSNDSDFDTFLRLIPGVDSTGASTGEGVLSSQTARPQAESLLDAGYYYKGEMLPVSEQAAMPSPPNLACTKNHVILITNGLSNKDDSPQLQTLVGDLDQDGADSVGYGLGSHYLDDVAKHLYEGMTKEGRTFRVSTHTIVAFQAGDPLLERAADSTHGRGHYYIAADANQLTKALTDAITNIMLEANTSFLAPVVPVSPENRTFSGSRVYMGFFKPMSDNYWRGNVKKYGINESNALTDRTGALACYSDANGDGRDDADGSVLPSGVSNGAFRPTSSSYWSSVADAATLEAGGAGEVLRTRDFTSNPRRIYTYTGSSSNLTDASNAFTVANSALDAALLGVADAGARETLINFIHGYDVHDENGNGVTSEKRGFTDNAPSGWIFGDILHSRPLIINYSSFAFSTVNEADCAVNKSMIYVGGNDGMLHAVRDCNGSEAWAFIPPDLLGNLKYMPRGLHTYFVDSNPMAYIYNSSNNGNINTANGDRVILIFGERRGGGSDSAPATGSYYALDVSDPATPRMMWRINGQTSGFEELGESWSEPKLVKMRIRSGETVDKIVAFIGAGYDNIHEDTRYGNTQSFSDAAAVVPIDVGNGDTTSGGSTEASFLTAPRGRGIYAIEVATLNSSGVPSFTGSGSKIWGYVYGATTASATPPASSTDSLLRYSIPGEIAAADVDQDGYADTLYAGDTGGGVWRFRVGSTSVANWGGERIFNLNSGTAVVGKKFFYRPSVVLEPGYTMLFMGSGDREHPLNRDSNLVDRMYALKDKGQTSASALGEDSLTDVTADYLQSTTATSGATSIPGIISSLESSYGWYISLDEAHGTKILSSPTVFNKVAYFTAFTPNSVLNDPCRPGNLGTSRLYAVDYKNGAAVMNYDRSNDTLLTSNAMATTVPGQVLQRSDRSMALGPGIPSGMVIFITPSGDPKALIGVGGNIAAVNPKRGGTVLPLYWRQK